MSSRPRSQPEPHTIRRLRRRVLSERRRRRRARELLAVVSHEMRDPLNAVLGMARLLADTPLDATQREYLDALLTACEGLLDLVNDLLDVSRLEAGRLELADVPFHLAPFIERLAALFRPRAQARGLAFTVALSEHLPARLQGDPMRLRQILVNLLANALKYTEEGGIALRVETVPNARPARLCFCVEDSGIGLGADPDQLFKPYLRAPSARAYGGVGLGLATARRLAWAMGGELRLCERPEGGTRAELLLPLRVPPSAGRPSRLEDGDLKGRRLLLCGFQPPLKQRLTQFAARTGLVVRTVPTARAALAALEEAEARREPPFDFLFVPHRLADMDAFHFARQVTARTGTLAPRLVLLTEAGLRGEAETAHRAGFDAFLPATLPESLLGRALMRLCQDPPGDLVTVHALEESRPGLEILVADDNPLNRRLLQALLERAGHRVHLAADGREALALACRRRFDLALLDLQMPRLDGIATARALRDQAPHLPVLGISGDLEPELRARCLAAGMRELLAKPVDPTRLLTLVSRTTGADPSPDRALGSA